MRPIAMFLLCAVVLCTVILLPPSVAYAEAIHVTERVYLDPGESFHFHIVDIDFAGIQVWVWINWLASGSVSIDNRLMANLHLDPLGDIEKHTESTHPFTEWESFRNIGVGNQILAGSTMLDGLPPQPFGPVFVPPGGVADVHVDADIPSQDGIFRLWKRVDNLLPVNNWWELDELTRAEITFEPGQAWHLHVFDPWPLNAILTADYVWIVNTGPNPIHFDFEFWAAPIPEPSTITLLGLGTLGLLGCAWRQRRPAR